MKQQQLLLAGGGALLLLAVVVVLRLPGEPEPPAEISAPPPPKAAKARTRPVTPVVPLEAPAPDRRTTVSPRAFEEKLGEMGFSLAADRTGRGTAEGNVEISGPGEVALRGDELRMAPDGKGFYLTGQVSMTTGSTTIESMDGKGFVRIGFDGNIECSPGQWQTETARPVDE